MNKLSFSLLGCLFLLSFFFIACAGNSEKAVATDTTETTSSTETVHTEPSPATPVEDSTSKTAPNNPSTQQNNSIKNAPPSPKKPIGKASNSNTPVLKEISDDEWNKSNKHGVEGPVDNHPFTTPFGDGPKATETTKSGGTKPNPVEFSIEGWDKLLRSYVSADGMVNYAGLKREKDAVDYTVTQMGLHGPKSDWSKNKEMAYWINLYNAFTISLILEKYPINSIMELDGGKVWTTQTVFVAGQAYTLDQIEKQMLLKKFNEPRVHFAVNCGAKSCPPILNKAWTESNIQSSFDQQAKLFINNPTFNNLSGKTIEISKIFEWYAADFGGAANIVAYLNKYASTKVDPKAKVTFKEYDWALNKK